MKPPPRLPPLGAVRAFEATVRLGSASAAAEELHVTHGAVSQQLRSLEEWFGAPLFERRGKRLVATPAGERFAEAANAGFTTVGVAAASLLRRQNSRKLTITTMPSFAARWLAPRIGRFIEAEPGVELNLIATEELQDLVREDIDIAIRFGQGNYPGLSSELLLSDRLLVAANPRYRGGRLPKRPEDLLDCDLLAGGISGGGLVAACGEEWEDWFRLAGIKGPLPKVGLQYNDSSLAVQAAVDGIGIVLTRASLSRQDLEAGRLVKLFDIEVPMAQAYWLVTRPDAPRTPLLDRFCAWLHREAAQEKRISEALANPC
jgi:LysR family glycine cleavage system transcriptional activator